MMHPKMKLDVSIVTCVTVFSNVANAFWRLPCRGRSGMARIDPIVAPGIPSDHVHAVHGSGGFSMSANEASLKQSSCTSCAVTQDKSAYWVPALYFMHQNGDAELVNEVGGMLAYYLLNGDNVTAFPENFRMMAGDTYKRDFPWPIPDPPQSEWSGNDLTQDALRQKAVGFNCLNYEKNPEPSLGRHYLPDKTYLDEHCTEGIRFELMFPSCWNGKDVDTPDHKSHLAYPSLVMDGECPKGFEHRLVSLFYESIWDTYAFKNKKGTFVISNGDPTGYGYHGDFMYGWDSEVLQQAVNTCTNMSGEVSDCPIFNLQSDEKQDQCHFPVPDALKNEDVNYHKGGLPNNLAIQSGPAYASPVRYTTTAGGHGRPTPVVIDDLPTVGIGIDLGFLSAGLHVALPTLATSSTSTTAKAWEPTAPPVVNVPPAPPLTSFTTRAHTTIAAPMASATSTASNAQLSIPDPSSESDISSVSVRPTLLASSASVELSTLATKSSISLASSIASSGVLAKPSMASPSGVVSSSKPSPSSVGLESSASTPLASTTASNLFAVSSPAMASPPVVKSSASIASAPTGSPTLAIMPSTPLLSPTKEPSATISKFPLMGVSSSAVASAPANTATPLFSTPNATVSATQAAMSTVLSASPASSGSIKSMVASSNPVISSATSTALIKTALQPSSTLPVADKPTIMATPSSTSAPLVKTTAQTPSTLENNVKPSLITSTSSPLVRTPLPASSTFAIVAKPIVAISSSTSAPLIKSTTSMSSTLAMIAEPSAAAMSPATNPSSLAGYLFASSNWEQITTWSPPSSTSSADTVPSTTFVYVEQEIIVLVDDQGVPIETQTGSLETVSKASSTISSGVSSGLPAPTRPLFKRDGFHNHAHKHYRHGHSH